MRRRRKSRRRRTGIHEWKGIRTSSEVADASHSKFYYTSRCPILFVGFFDLFLIILKTKR
jgi:hypothetical protein